MSYVWTGHVVASYSYFFRSDAVFKLRLLSRRHIFFQGDPRAQGQPRGWTAPGPPYCPFSPTLTSTPSSLLFWPCAQRFKAAAAHWDHLQRLKTALASLITSNSVKWPEEGHGDSKSACDVNGRRYCDPLL